MYLLSFLQEDRKTKIGLFESLQEGRKFLKKIPGFRFIKEDDFIYEGFKYSEIPEYVEVEINNNIVPISRFMFPSEEFIDIVWEEVHNFSNEGKGIVEGLTKIDSYLIDNRDLEEYIKSREDRYRQVKSLLENEGFQVKRDFLGSEDGEAVLYKKPEEKNWTFLVHMDPVFVYDNDQEYLDYIE